MVDNKYLKANNPLLVIHYILAMLDWKDNFLVNFAYLESLQNICMTSSHMKLMIFGILQLINFYEQHLRYNPT